VRLALFFIPLALSAQSVTSKWYLHNHVGQLQNGSQQCWTPGNVSAESGTLTITSKAQTWICGDSTHAQALYNYTAGAVTQNSQPFIYPSGGRLTFIFSNVMMQGIGQGIHEAIWLLGAYGTPGYRGGLTSTNCQVGFKLEMTADIGNCQWPKAGSEEIDIYEAFGTSIDFALHYYSSGIDAYSCTVSTSTVNPATSHNIELDWSAGSLTWKVDETTECSTTSFVPSTPMFLLFTTSLCDRYGGSCTFSDPQKFTIGEVKVVSSVGPTTLLDETWNGTGGLPEVYVAEDPRGQNTGLSCQDAFGLVNPSGGQATFFNDPGWWGQQIGNGTQVHFCGNISTYTTQPQIPAAGGSVQATLIANDPSLVPMLQSVVAGSLSTVGQDYDVPPLPWFVRIPRYHEVLPASPTGPDGVVASPIN
jgi:hypothetical protein